MDKQLIFLLSPPRSGSSMLQRIISQSKDVYSVAESNIMFLAHSNHLNGTINQATNYVANNGALNPNLIVNAKRDFTSTLYKAVLDAQGKHIFLDKTPAYTKIASKILSTYPDAKYIILLRNPLGLLQSCLSTWIKGDYQKLYWCHYDLVGSLTDLHEFIKDKKK